MKDVLILKREDYDFDKYLSDLNRIFSPHEVHYDLAFTTENALDMLHNNKYDVILVGYVLKGFLDDGLSFIRQFREQDNHTKVILHTCLKEYREKRKYDYETCDPYDYLDNQKDIFKKYLNW